MRCGRRAAQLAPDDDATWWNLGIAATATGAWPLAREAWRHCGLEVPHGDGEIEPMGLGLVPIRIQPEVAPEVIWAERLDPARARLENVPLPTAARSWGDIVLHDGVPVGERVLNGRAVPVFDELELLEPSGVPRLEVHVLAPTIDDSHALEERFRRSGGAAEDWTTSVRHLCDTCSRGAVPASSDARDEWEPERHFGLAASFDDAHEVLTAWAGGGTQRRAGAPSAIE